MSTERLAQTLTLEKFIGTNLYIARNWLGWSVQQSADKMKITVDVVNQYESGAGVCLFCYVRKFAEASGIPASVIVEKEHLREYLLDYTL